MRIRRHRCVLPLSYDRAIGNQGGMQVGYSLPMTITRAESVQLAKRSQRQLSGEMSGGWTIVKTLAGAGIAAFQSASDDLSWTVQKMDGWKAAGQHATPTVTVPESSLNTTAEFTLSGPIHYQAPTPGYPVPSGAPMPTTYQHFGCRFSHDGTGVGRILVDTMPDANDSIVGGGLRVDMQINPLPNVFPSMQDASVEVACVELRIFYYFDFDLAENDTLVVTHRFFGDGSRDATIRGGEEVLHGRPYAWSGFQRNWRW